eukprot:4712746-Alexandrium_andersonii.AAC.1
MSQVSIPAFCRAVSAHAHIVSDAPDVFPRLQFTRAALLNCICYLVHGDHRRGQRLWSRVLPDRA